MKRIILLVLIMLTAVFSLSCKQEEEVKILLPPEKGEEITFKTGNLLYQNDGSTLYSIGDMNSEFTFFDDTLDVNDSQGTKIYTISYDEKAISLEDIKKEILPIGLVLEDEDYKNIVQYDLSESRDKIPGYRLYVLDDEYWMATLYKDSVWRIVSLTNELDESKNHGVVVAYSDDHLEDIFGDLSEEKIENIIDEIVNKVSEDDKYDSGKKDSIIEDVFKENGIQDENKISAAKSRIKISK